jgi:ornithine cyclodeaminase
MHNDEIFILKNHEVLTLLSGRENDIVQAVGEAYRIHGAQQSSLPHSLFLRFPDNQRNRIIALPAYLGGGFDVAGMKWIASFPGNIEHGIDRASAVIILNSPQTGRPLAIIEGSAISAKRTAASAALAASSLSNGHHYAEASLLGCGVINFEVARFLLNTCPEIKAFKLFDLDPERAAQFKVKLEETFDGTEVSVASNMETAMADSQLVSLATTAIDPHISNLSACAPAATILHVSLRDLTPEVILTCDNIVDDIDHVSRAQTSVHLAEQLTGNRDFIRCTLADILSGNVAPRTADDSIAVFSPFGLGILDMALAKLVYDVGRQEGIGTVIESFLPSSWAPKHEASGK